MEVRPPTKYWRIYLFKTRSKCPKNYEQRPTNSTAGENRPNQSGETAMEVLIDEMDSRMQAAMTFQDFDNDREFLAHRIMEIGMTVVEETEMDVSRAHLLVKKHFGTRQEYKDSLVAEVVALTQGNREKLAKENTIKQLETTLETLADIEIR